MLHRLLDFWLAIRVVFGAHKQYDQKAVVRAFYSLVLQTTSESLMVPPHVLFRPTKVNNHVDNDVPKNAMWRCLSRPVQVRRKDRLSVMYRMKNMMLHMSMFEIAINRFVLFVK